MMSAFVSLLFAAAICLALAAIASSWRTYGAQVLSLRQQLAACDSVRELRFVTVTTMVRLEGDDLWRPGFRPLAAQMQVRRPHSRPLRQPELRPELRHAAA
jgi:hypothetical protein